MKQNINVNQWKNTTNVIDWFNKIESKSSCSFTQFDIVEYYPSISEDLLMKSINYAKSLTTVTDEDIHIIMHARKSILFNNEEPWTKKNGNAMFDVTMGSFDGAEICELVGLFILQKLGQKFNSLDLGLYRDDGLALFRGKSDKEMDNIRKEFIKIFKELDLRITIETNLKIVNFLDVTLNLNTGKYKPYNKPNDKPMYINTRSNHPQNILKKLPESIGQRINNLSADQTIFENAAPYYNEALKASGYNQPIQYHPENKGKNVQQNSKKRKRNIIWYNPPYSLDVKTNIARKFLCLIDKHFPKNHKLHKIFNRNNVKVSYSCMPNIGNIIKSHNQQILHENDQSKQQQICNCREKDKCPLQGNCLTRSLVYQGEVTDGSQNSGNYIGLTEYTFKGRSYQHLNSFKYRNKANSTEMSKYVWNLKDQGITNPTITWSILDNAIPYKNGSKRCDLCITEKYHIIQKSDNILNKRDELISKCRHENKYYLSNFKSVPPDK
jgi:hypothetical protein